MAALTLPDVQALHAQLRRELHEELAAVADGLVGAGSLAARLGGDPSQIFVGGHSYGGPTAMLQQITATVPGVHYAVQPLIAGFVKANGAGIPG